MAVLQKMGPTPPALSKRHGTVETNPNATGFGCQKQIAKKRSDCKKKTTEVSSTYTTTTTVTMPSGKEIARLQCVTQPRRRTPSGSRRQVAVNKREMMAISGGVKGVRGRVIDVEELRYYPASNTDTMVSQACYFVFVLSFGPKACYVGRSTLANFTVCQHLGHSFRGTGASEEATTDRGRRSIWFHPLLRHF